MLAPLSSAFACMVSKATVVGELKGNGSYRVQGSNQRMCKIQLKILQVSYDRPNCRLPLQIGKIRTLKTNLTLDECPDTEGMIRGVIISAGGGLFMRLKN